MKGFKQFVTEDEEVAKSIAKLPKKFQKLVKGYKFQFEAGNTLKGDKGHVGMITNHPEKIIRIAAPWRYGREFTLFHEIGHLVYEMVMRGSELEQKWEKLSMSTPGRKKDETAEELWCHCFASIFVEYPPEIHHHPEWVDFMNKYIISDK